MATTTTNYSFVKPTLGVDAFDLSDWNGNMDLIDTTIKSVIDTHEASTTAHGSDDIINDSSVAGSDISEALDGLDTRISNIIAQSGTSDTEVVDARYDPYLEKTFTTLKDRLDVYGENILKIDSVGIQWNQTTDTITRISLKDNITQSDFDNIYPWSEMTRCNLNDDGIVTAYYGDPTYAEDGSNGQCMVEIPKVYYKYSLDTTGDRIFTWEFSAIPQPGFEIHPAFRKGNIYKDKIYVSSYEGCLYDTSAGAYLLADEQVGDFTATTGDVLGSIANAKPASGLTQNLTIVNARTVAENRGTGWGLLNCTAVDLIQKLLYIEYASLNSQTAIGRGIVDKASGTGNESELTGATSSLGNTSGDAGGTDGLTSVSYRGIENLWGNIWSWVDGINIKADNELWINPTNENFVSDSYISPYLVQGTLSDSNGYVSNILDTQYGMFATSVGGSSSIYLTDYYYQTTGNRVALLGGSWNYGSSAGCACWHFTFSSGDRIRVFGARSCFI